MDSKNNGDLVLKQSVSNICIRIDELDDSTRRYIPEDPILWRVPPSLHYVNPKAFTPVTVAIAPLHRFSTLIDTNGPYAYAFKHMERCKLIAARVACSHLRVPDSSTPSPISFRSLAGALMSDNGIAKIRSFYSTEFNLDSVSDDQIAAAFALDCCFVVEMMRCLSEDQNQSMNPDHGSAATEFSRAYQKMSYATRDAVVQDILLLESQLPLSVIRKVVELDGRFSDSNQAESDGGLQRMIDSIAGRALPFCKSVDRNNLGRSGEHHLLDCLYRIVTAPDKVDEIYKKRTGKAAESTKITVPSATQLQNCGVKFVGHDGSLRRIEFQKNKLTLPIIHVGDETEKIFRNLLSYEATQRQYEAEPGGAGTVLSYLHFMNSLINTADDVALLQNCGVLVMDNVGDHVSVAAMWNKLSTNTPCVYTHTYRTVAGLVNEYSQNVIHSMAYEFEQRYFARPWLIVSLISGIVLLVMTFLTMFYTMELYYAGG